MCTHSHILVANDRNYCIDFPFEIVFGFEKEVRMKKEENSSRKLEKVSIIIFGLSPL
jgi:hypothetical protein